LAIARDLVTLHGGKIEAHSEGLNKGSRFTVTLPLPKVRRKRSEAPLSVSDAQHTAQLDQVSILLVEDNAASAAAMTALLTGAGAHVTAVGSGTEAMDAYTKHPPQLIISDIAMPDMDGYALIARIRQIESDAKRTPVPALALSAFTREEDRSKAISSEFHDHVSKPLDPQKIISRLAELLREK